MRNFSTEVENSVVEKDIVELEEKIRLLNEGSLDENSFKSLRVARGIYGQRQKGVQMVRIKLPLGIISPAQLRRISDVSDQFSDEKLHLTTRQDIQLYNVSLNETPNLWRELERDSITIREACGNVVRNITTSPYAGIDIDEPFDITEIGWSLFEFFQRNPIGQEMGRKFKIAISSTKKDLARTYINDLGLIPKIQNKKQGFKVLLGGGLGSQPAKAEVIKEFLPLEDLFPYAEAILKVFDKNGERNNRNRARLKFLIKNLGIDSIIEKIDKEFKSSSENNFKLVSKPLYQYELSDEEPEQIRNYEKFKKWSLSSLQEQKQNSYYSILIKIKNGNITTKQSRVLADIIEKYSQDEARLTIEQNLVIRFVPSKFVGNIYNILEDIDLVDYGADSISDITSCPGTSSCNLAITSSRDVSEVIENLLKKEYYDIIKSEDIKIKISGCMNSCGQHFVADIGFHGSTIRSNDSIFPALQVLLGGKNLRDGKAQFADRIIKIPTKRVETAIRIILNDYKNFTQKGELFNDYYNRREKNYFNKLLKELTIMDNATDYELLDWGAEGKFKPEVGGKENSVIKIDLIKTQLDEAKAKNELAYYFIEDDKYRDALYSAYSSVIQSAKSYLLKIGAKTNSKTQIAKSFEEFYQLIKHSPNDSTFENFLNSYSQPKPDRNYAVEYNRQAEKFHKAINELIYKK